MSFNSIEKSGHSEKNDVTEQNRRLNREKPSHTEKSRVTLKKKPGRHS